MATESLEPHVVYHYTTMDTMLKIVESRTIWASNMAYLNDTSEGRHFVDQVRDRLPEFSKQKGHGSEFISEMTNEVPFQMRPYVVSFSSEGDSLPQWRSYCPNGNGVAIGFSVDCLQRAFLGVPKDGGGHNISAKVTPVKYSQKRVPDSAIDTEISDLIEASDAFCKFASTPPNSAHIKRETVFRLLADIQASFKKHASFAHEREYRIVVNPAIMAPKPTPNFRAVRTALVPYLTLGIPEKRVGYEHLEYQPPTVKSILGGSTRFQFIDRVVIGPTPNKDLSLQAVREYFNVMRINAEVESSDIPFREW